MEQWTYDQYLSFMEKNWRLSEHISIVAPTGSGKTFIVRDLLNMKKHAVVIATKSKDKSLEKYVTEDGFVRRDTWPPDWYETHVMLWKTAPRLGDYRDQQMLIYRCMDDLYIRGGYCLYFDDLFYICQTLKLKSQVQMLYTQVRSGGVSLLSSQQRPRWGPLEAVSQATYIIIFRTGDKYDIERVAEGVSYDKKQLIAAVAELEKYEFLLLRVGEEPIHIEKRRM